MKMKLEDQVTSLELSKKLKELGVKQESLFWWVEHEYHVWDVWFRLSDDVFFTHERSIHSKPTRRRYSAFTVAELGEMLPWDIVISRNIDKEWIVTFQADGRTEKDTASFIGTEPDARAKMLIYLIENDLIGAGSN